MSDGGLITTEELLTRLCIAIRMSSYHAIDCGNHLAVHSTPEFARVCHEVAVRLSELAVVARDIADAHGDANDVRSEVPDHF